MGFINLLKNGYTGKVGETVGQKWKNTLTLRTYNEHNNSKSIAQLDQRAHYKSLITMSSKLYGYSVGFPRNASKKMNDFNLFTSVTETLLKTGINNIFSTPISVFSKTSIIASTVYYGTVNQGFALYESNILNMSNYKKIRPVIIPFPQDDNPQILVGNMNPVGNILPIIVDDGQPNIKPGKAFFFTPYFFYNGTVDTIYAFGIPYNGKYIYTQFVNIAHAPHQSEFSYNINGDDFDVTLTN